MNINFNLPALFIKPISNNHLLNSSPFLVIFCNRINVDNKFGEIYYIRPQVIYYKKTKILKLIFDNNNLVNLNKNIVDNIIQINGNIIIENYNYKGSLNEQNVIVNLNIKNPKNIKINAITINNGNSKSEMGFIGKIIYFLYVKKYWINKMLEFTKNNVLLKNLLPNTNLIQNL